jgi:hypothetical protein
MNYVFLLLILFLTGCNQNDNSTQKASAEEIESPLRNTCQSGDLDPYFPKCEWKFPSVEMIVAKGGT